LLSSSRTPFQSANHGDFPENWTRIKALPCRRRGSGEFGDE
jgi:hypothetical protein